MSGGPTGLTLRPMTSPGSKKMPKLSFMSLPVNVRTPRSNISATTFASILSSTSERGSFTSTTRPGNAPGSACLPFGTFMKSLMFVSGAAGGVRSWAPRERRHAEHDTAGGRGGWRRVFTNSRRVTSVDVGMGW